MSGDAERIAAGMSKAQREAVLEGRVRDCPYNHPEDTRCPNCAKWPFRKGGAAQFVATMRNIINGGQHGE